MSDCCTFAHSAPVTGLLRCVTICLVMLACLVSGGAASAAEAAAGFRAGVARVKITPQQPVWMAGYAARTKPAEGTLNELWAKVLVLDDAAGKRVALITLDVCGIDRETSDRIRDQMKEKLALNRDAVAICVSHTHSGPVVGHNLRPTYGLSNEESQKIRDYTAWMEAQIIQAAGKAAEAMSPVTLRYGVGTATFATNRRANKEAEVAKVAGGEISGAAAWRKPLKGPFDHDVPVLSIAGADGKPIAIIFGYACHATTLSGYDWSGDWPGFAAEAIEANHPGATAMFVAGCGADQNPMPRRDVGYAKAYGRQTADGVQGALSGKLHPIAGAITAKYSEVDLPFGQLPSREALEQQKASKDAKDRYLARRASLLLERLGRDGKLAETYAYPVQTWKMGDSGPTMVFLGGEVVVEYALRLKKEFGGNRAVWPIGYANDIMAYIPSARVLKEGGYEGATSMVYYGQPTTWGEQLEEKIIAEVRRQMQ